MHHPMMGMPMMTPHGLPPITPSMPSFTFLPQPSPGLPSPAAMEPDRAPMHAAHGHLQHVMAPYTPFSPGVTMSPGAFWGRPGSGANPFINPAVGAPVRPGYYAYGQVPGQQQLLQQQQQQQQQGQGQQADGQQEQEGRPPDGYFPPVPARVGEEPAGYFPWMPPPPQAQSQLSQEQRTSGLANEILREDSSARSNGHGHGHRHEQRESPSESETTTATGSGSGTSGQGSSSRGTSWHTDSEDAGVKAQKAQIRAQAQARGGLDPDTLVVEDAVGESPGAAENGSGSGSGSGKPRAYSAETGAGAAGGGRGGMHRADSDPVRQMLRGAT